MAIDKIQAESINLADTFAFTGTVTGTPNDMKHLLTTTISSAVNSISFGSTYVNSSYPVYVLYFRKVTLSEDSNLAIRIGSSGSVLTDGYRKGGFEDSFGGTAYGGIYSGGNENRVPIGGHHENTNGVNNYISGKVTFFDLRTTGGKKHGIIEAIREGTTGTYRFQNTGWFSDSNTSANDIIEFGAMGSSANMTTGEISLYGVSA
jgi:hypothetical protein